MTSERLLPQCSCRPLGDELARLRAHRATLDRDERANRFVQSDCAKLRLEQIANERTPTEAEIAKLESLTNKQIVAKFKPVQEQPVRRGRELICTLLIRRS